MHKKKVSWDSKNYIFPKVTVYIWPQDRLALFNNYIPRARIGSESIAHEAELKKPTSWSKIS